MSDIPPSRFRVPELPNEVMVKIFLYCDAKSLIRVQATCRFWREHLSGYEFVNEIGEIWRDKGCSLFGHFGYRDMGRRSLDWTIKMSPESGHRFPSTLPFVLSQKGWFDIIGVDKGIFCFRLSMTGEVSNLLIWNPMSHRERLIGDPIQGAAEDGTFLYSFQYFPQTVNYSIVAIFLEGGKEGRCVFTVYDSSTREWSERLPCPPYVRKLDPAYVTRNGMTFWITWSHDPDNLTRPFIVSFSSLTHTFNQIPLPDEALTTCHTLLLKDGNLCVAANNHNADGYTTMIWQVDVVGEELVWSPLFDITGNAHAFIPGAMVDGNVIQISERHIDVAELDDMEYTNIHIRRFYTATRRRRSLLWVSYEDDVKLRSIHMYHEGFYPI